MTSERSAREIHELAEKTREQDRLAEALQLFSQAIHRYNQDQNWQGVAEALQGRCLTYKHLYLQFGNESDRFSALTDAQSSLKLAEEQGFTEMFSSNHFRIAEIQMLSNDFNAAATNYEKAVKLFGSKTCEKGDYTYHWGEALYKAGKKEEGRQKLFEGLKMIQDNASDADLFLAHVWESGAHGRIAECLRVDEPDIAREHLRLCRQVIDLDPRLVIRRRQLEQLEKLFN